MKGDEVVKTGKEEPMACCSSMYGTIRAVDFIFAKSILSTVVPVLPYSRSSVLLEAMKYCKSHEESQESTVCNNFNILVDGGWFPQLCNGNRMPKYSASSDYDYRV